MENVNYRNSEGREEEMGETLEGLTCWPLFALMGILGGFLFWEALSPLPLIPAQVVSLAGLGLVFGGIALWVILFVNK